MTVSPTFRLFVLEQLQRCVAGLRAKNMFGGVGIYSGDLFFALIADDTLYFEVDDVTRPDFVALGLKPFQPYGEGGEVMQYYQIAEELLEDAEALRTWADRAVAVAQRARRGRKRKSGR